MWRWRGDSAELSLDIIFSPDKNSKYFSESHAGVPASVPALARLNSANKLFFLVRAGEYIFCCIF